MARFAKALKAQEDKHLKSYLKILVSDQIGPEDANSVLWMLASTSRLARLNSRLGHMAKFLHYALVSHDELPWDMYVPEDVAAAMLGPVLPTTVTKALRFTEKVWFPEIKRTYLQFAAQFNPDNLKEMAEAMNYYVRTDSYMISMPIGVGTFYHLWALCRGWS